MNLSLILLRYSRLLKLCIFKYIFVRIIVWLLHGLLRCRIFDWWVMKLSQLKRLLFVVELLIWTLIPMTTWMRLNQVHLWIGLPADYSMLVFLDVVRRRFLIISRNCIELATFCWLLVTISDNGRIVLCVCVLGIVLFIYSKRVILHRFRFRTVPQQISMYGLLLAWLHVCQPRHFLRMGARSAFLIIFFHYS